MDREEQVCHKRGFRHLTACDLGFVYHVWFALMDTGENDLEDTGEMATVGLWSGADGMDTLGPKSNLYC